MRGRSRFKLSRYRRERLVELNRRCEYLEAERNRLERLLGLALRMAVKGSPVNEGDLLEALCALEGTNPALAAMFETRE